MAVRSLSIAVLACVAGLAPGTARTAACSNAYKQWSETAGASGLVASAPANDTNFPAAPNRSRSYFAQGTQLFTYYNSDYPIGCTPAIGSGTRCFPNGVGNTCTRLAGCQAETWNAPSTISNFPNPVPLSSNSAKEYVFLGADSGYLYRLDVTGEGPYPTVAADTRRPSCVSDKVVATPAVQLYAYANQAFRDNVDSFPAHAQDDVVFVVTFTSCGDATHNRIIAYWASDLSVKWTFNAATQVGQESGSIQIGGGTEGCSIDYANNRLFCGTDAPTGSSADTLWALNTLDGSLVWSDNPGGAVLNRPMLHQTQNKLYVVSKPGSLWAYDPAGNGLGGPSRVWSAGMSVAGSGAIVTRSPWVEHRSGTWQNRILVLDSLGTLSAIQDNGTSGTLLWARVPTDAAQWVSNVAVLPGASESLAYIGRDDGHLQQIKLDGGAPQGIIQIASSTSADVYDPTLDFDPVTGLAIMVVGGNQAVRVSVPICPDDPGA